MCHGACCIDINNCQRIFITHFPFFPFRVLFLPEIVFRNRNYCWEVGRKYACRGGHAQTNISFARLLFDNSAYTRQTRAWKFVNGKLHHWFTFLSLVYTAARRGYWWTLQLPVFPEPCKPLVVPLEASRKLVILASESHALFTRDSVACVFSVSE